MNKSKHIEEVLFYSKVTAYIYRNELKESDNIEDIKLHIKSILPRRLNTVSDQIPDSKFSIDLFSDYEENRKCYHSLCLNILKIIFLKDNIKIEYLNPQLFNYEHLDHKDINTKIPNNQSLRNCGVIAKTGNHHLYFGFYDQGKEFIDISDYFFVNDRNDLENLALLILEPKNNINEFRKIENANRYKRTFFLSFEKIREKALEINEDKYLKICSRPLEEEDFNQNSSSVKTFRAKIIKQIQVGGEKSDLYKLRFKTNELQEIVPGQFIMINTKPTIINNKTKNKDNSFAKRNEAISYLKRPFGIHRTYYKNFSYNYLKKIILPQQLSTILHTIFPDEFDVFYKVLKHGIGTNELKNVKEKEDIEILGPLGRRDDLRILSKNGYKEIHVIGGGVGMAPLIFIIQALKYFNLNIKAFIGIESYNLLKHKDDSTYTHSDDLKDARIYIDDLLDTGLKKEDIFVAIDKKEERQDDISDVNLSDNEFISHTYQRYLGTLENTDDIYAFTCGPDPMMKAVYDITSEHNIPLKVLLEKRMACGIGVCFSCVCELKDKDGEKHYSRVCIDGPLYNSEEINW